MDMMQVANELVAGCREGRERANLDKLYADNCESVEAADFGGGRSVTGIDAIKGKHDWWEGAMELHDLQVSEPMPHGDNRFAIIFEMDVTTKETGKRDQMCEVGVYSVADGKIVKEEFFYPLG